IEGPRRGRSNLLVAIKHEEQLVEIAKARQLQRPRRIQATEQSRFHVTRARSKNARAFAPHGARRRCAVGIDGVEVSHQHDAALPLALKTRYPAVAVLRERQTLDLPLPVLTA